MTAAAVHHPARYSAVLLDTIRPALAGAPHVHDPFAGTGERLGALCDELGVTYSGTEIEPSFIVDPRVRQGDSRRWPTYPPFWPVQPGSAPERVPYWIATSPVYANGMADNFRPTGICSYCNGVAVDPAGEECPKCKGTGRRAIQRHTYRMAKMLATGDPAAELAEGNMGRNSYRQGHRARGRYWEIAGEVVRQWYWAERVVLNVSDFIMQGQAVPHVAEWWDLMRGHGWHLAAETAVRTPRQRNGANAAARAATEAVGVFTRS